MYVEFKDALVTDAALVIDNTLPHLENTFAPVPPPKSDAWLNTLLGLVALGVPMVGGKFFDDGTPPNVLCLITVLDLLTCSCSTRGHTSFGRQECNLERSLQRSI
jgi:hypothetical protein